MGKIIDFLLTNDWEVYQRVQLYKKIGKALENISDEELKEILKEIKKRKK